MQTCGDLFIYIKYKPFLALLGGHTPVFPWDHGCLLVAAPMGKMTLGVKEQAKSHKCCCHSLTDSCPRTNQRALPKHHMEVLNQVQTSHHKTYQKLKAPKCCSCTLPCLFLCVPQDPPEHGSKAVFSLDELWGRQKLCPYSDVLSAHAEIGHPEAPNHTLTGALMTFEGCWYWPVALGCSTMNGLISISVLPELLDFWQFPFAFTGAPWKLMFNQWEAGKAKNLHQFIPLWFSCFKRLCLLFSDRCLRAQTRQRWQLATEDHSWPSELPIALSSTFVLNVKIDQSSQPSDCIPMVSTLVPIMVSCSRFWRKAILFAATQLIPYYLHCCWRDSIKSPAFPSLPLSLVLST